MEVKIVNKSRNPLPEYQTANSAGFDLMANIEDEKSITIMPNKTVLIQTGLYVEIPMGFEMQIRPRSGLALKRGITVLNSPGTIDADYRGEVCVILHNTSTRPMVIKNGYRIAQGVITKYEIAEWKCTESLSETNRGEGGFGSTDK